MAYEEVLSDMRRRDEKDRTRAAAPLRQAEDAVVLDTSELDFEDSAQALLRLIRRASAMKRNRFYSLAYVVSLAGDSCIVSSRCDRKERIPDGNAVFFLQSYQQLGSAGHHDLLRATATSFLPWQSGDCFLAGGGKILKLADMILLSAERRISGPSALQ